MPARHHPTGSRGEPREIAELRRIKETQPALSSAVDLQIGLLELQRRVQSRVPLPWIELDPAWLKKQQAAGNPLLRFEDIPLDWTDFRLMFRQTADLMRRHDALEEDDYQNLQRFTRESGALEPVVMRWYNAAARAGQQPPSAVNDPAVPDSIDRVLTPAMQPFLARCAEAILPLIKLDAWTSGHCPLCGDEPELAVITPLAERFLICGRCTARWKYDPIACPFCGNSDRSRITSFASRDGIYRLYACDICLRYLKAYDGRNAARQVMVPVDSVATLPLDAAAIQRGYRG